MPISDLYDQPWLRFVPPGASPELAAHIQQMWMRGERPTANGWAFPGQPPTAQAGPAAGAPPPPVAPAAPAPPDYGSLVSGDPEYIRRMADLQAQQRTGVLGFGDATGIDLDPNTPGVQTDPNLAGAAANNPNSILAQLRMMGQQQQQGITNTAQSHGALFSGANAQAQQNEGVAQQQRAYSARQDFQTQQNQLAAGQGQAYWDVYNRLAQNPPGVGAPPAQPNPPMPAHGYTPPSPGMPQGSVNFTGQPDDQRPVVGMGYHAPGGYPPTPRPKLPPKPKLQPGPAGIRRT